MNQEKKGIQDEIHEMMLMQESENQDNGWLSTNESVETVSDFEMFAEQLNRVSDDPHRWKWAVIALHSGLQGMMVLALRGSDYMNVIRQDEKKQYSEVSDDERSGKSSRNDLKLIGFTDLYAWIKGTKMIMYTDSQKFVPSGTQSRSIKTLNRLRNKFVHFTPKVWRLDLGGLPEIASDCLEIAEFLAWESGNVRFRLSIKPDLEKRLQDAFTSARESLWALQQQGFQNDDTNAPV